MSTDKRQNIALQNSLNKGDNLTITFTFKANPLSQDIKWVVTIPEIVNSGNGNETSNETVVELTPGHEDDKYMISNLTSDVDLQYKATMTIFDLEDQVRLILRDIRGRSQTMLTRFCPLLTTCLLLFDICDRIPLML